MNSVDALLPNNISDGEKIKVKRPEVVAQIAPHFDGVEIPAFGKDNLWFL